MTSTREKDIRVQVKEYLQWQGWFVFYHLQGLGSYPGLPDLQAVRGRQVLFIEIKAPGGRQSRAQKQFQRDLERAGGTYLLVRDTRDLHQHVYPRRWDSLPYRTPAGESPVWETQDKTGLPGEKALPRPGESRDKDTPGHRQGLHRLKQLLFPPARPPGYREAGDRDTGGQAAAGEARDLDKPAPPGDYRDRGPGEQVPPGGGRLSPGAGVGP